MFLLFPSKFCLQNQNPGISNWMGIDDLVMPYKNESQKYWVIMDFSLHSVSWFSSLIRSHKLLTKQHMSKKANCQFQLPIQRNLFCVLWWNHFALELKISQAVKIPNMEVLFFFLQVDNFNEIIIHIFSLSSF